MEKVDQKPLQPHQDGTYHASAPGKGQMLRDHLHAGPGPPSVANAHPRSGRINGSLLKPLLYQGKYEAEPSHMASR